MRGVKFTAARQFSTGTKFGGGGKARAGKNSFPPTPFLFARPSAKVFQNSAFGFSLKKVRISFRVRSHLGLLASSRTRLNGERKVKPSVFSFTVGF